MPGTESGVGPAGSDGEGPIGVYKRLLRAYLDRRPSGTRQRIATEIGTHRSFVTQITNPAYRVPLPAQHVPTILDVCHFSAEERKTFLAAYEAAHPGQLAGIAAAAERTDGAEPPVLDPTGTAGVWIPLPAFADSAQATRVARAIRSAAAAIIAAVEQVEPTAAGRQDKTSERKGERS